MCMGYAMLNEGVLGVHRGCVVPHVDACHTRDGFMLWPGVYLAHVIAHLVQAGCHK